MITSLPIDQEVSGLIPDFAVVFFSSGELFHGMYGLDVFVLLLSLIHVLSSSVLEETSAFY